MRRGCLKKRLLSMILAVAMVITMVPALLMSSIEAKATSSVYVTLHFDLSTWGWGQPALQYWGGSSTTVVGDGDSYNFEAWNVDITNLIDDGDGWYEITLNGDFSGFQILDANNSSNCTNGVGYDSAMANLVSDSAVDIYACPNNWDWSNSKAYWYLDKSLTNSIDNYGQDVDDTTSTVVNPWANASEKTSPIVNSDNTITFVLDATGDYANVTSVSLMGTLPCTDWSDGLAMTLSDDGEVWTVTTPVIAPGVYEYKYKYNGSTWICDPLNDPNDGGNSKVVVAGLSEGYLDIMRNTATELPTTLAFYSEDGTSEEVEVSYSCEDSDVTIEDGLVTVGGSASSVELIASYESYSSKFTLYIKDSVYTYNLYYFDEDASHMAVDAADIWAWEIDGGNLGPFSFDSLVTLEDGNQWLKATFTSSAKNLGLIPRSNGGWTWQTVNHYFYNTNGDDECDIYIINGDENTYSSLPSSTKVEKRYVIVEYDRDDEDYDGWNIYTWNSGFGSEVTIDPVEVNGKEYIIVPVKTSTVDFTLSFCMRRSTDDNAWAEKDGGDHYIVVPANQSVVKAVFTEGEGVTSILPYNKGYEMSGADKKISFYYRDDELLLTDEEASLEDEVSVVINGSEYAMDYDEENERYEYELTDITTGDYAYYYIVGDEELLDSFNENTTYYDGKECSLVTYKSFDSLEVEASLSQDKMDYTENNVLTVELVTDDDETISDDEIASVYANLSELGLGELEVDTELMELTISVLDTTTLGNKNIDVTVNDIYGNVYTTTASVEIVEKTSNDFDWDEAVIYFTVTDRFYDGNSTNNDGVDKDGSLSYHGGDFAGLEEKLDYLEDLGINTIWITPIVDQSNTTTEKDGETIESTGYHGYWASDFTELSSYLGTEEEFSSLIEAVHARGMKLMVDVVLNHAGYETEDYFNTILTDEDGNYIEMIRSAENTVSGDDVYDSLSGLPDFVTEDPAVRNQLIEWQVNWIEKYDIDYFRVDTVKHVDATTWAAFKNELTKANSSFKLIGEYSGAGYGNTASELGTGTMDSLLDFDFNDFAQNYVTGNISSVENSLVARNSSINNTATLGAFLSSHDEDGLVYKLINENGLTEEEALNVFKVAAALELTAKGQAVIYYGEEIGQYGANDYPYQTNRYDFDWDEAAAQAEDSSSMLNHYKKLLAIRKQYASLLAKGDRQTILSSDSEGYDVFERSYLGTNLYVGLNITNSENEVTFEVAEAAGTVLKDMYGDGSYVVSEDGTVTVTIPASSNGGTVILVKEAKQDAAKGDDEKKDDCHDGKSPVDQVIEQTKKAVGTVQETIKKVVETIVKIIVKPIISPIVNIFNKVVEQTKVISNPVVSVIKSIFGRR